MENTSETQSSSEGQKSKNKKTVLNKKMMMITIAVAALVASGFGLYSYAFSKGEEAGEKNIKDSQARDANDRLLALPASGEVSMVNKDEIEVKLLGDETRKAKINKETQISGKSGKLSVGDIKKGGRAILFTKKDGNDIVATRIVVQ